ncbi:MAG TPA: PH domain-containing protein [Desulfobacteria bacterium]|nr:PH domain-containing protein [Desulfobacteria bacterium]
MKTFKPVQGRGFLWGIVIMIFVGFILTLPITFSMVSGTVIPGFIAVMTIISALVAAMMGYFTWSAKSMEYILGDKEITIKWAFNKKTIPIDSILGLTKTVGTSSFKVMGASWPGFHIGSFTDPTGKGSVNLFATRLWGEILLIRTKWEVVGITPSQSDEFLHDLEKIMPNLKEGSFSNEDKVEPYSPRKDKLVITLISLTAIILAGTGLFLYNIIPTLPSKVPMHFNLAGQIDRYGSPKEIYKPFGIGVLVIIMLFGINIILARNNKASIRMMAFVSLFISIIFSLIAIGMAISA